MNIPFTKAHGARNDFLLTWAEALPAIDLAKTAIAICDRNTGVGADGWLLVYPPGPSAPARIRLFNPDGGEVEMSGNGTRCAAALLVDAGLVGRDIQIVTGAGLKHLTLIRRQGNSFEFEMNMGVPQVDDPVFQLQLKDSRQQATILNVGNPQCALFVDNFDFDWKAMGAEIEHHAHFPSRTNVSFIKTIDPHTLDVRFFERGAGFTMSSGTGSTGAVVAAIHRGLAQSPVTVQTLAGPLHFRWEGPEVMMIGPAELTARGDFLWGIEPAPRPA